MKHYKCEKYQQQKSNQTDVGSCQYNKFVAILEDLKCFGEKFANYFAEVNLHTH